jgi:3-deoxy-7-phosphoheptulonate synthase
MKSLPELGVLRRNQAEYHDFSTTRPVRVGPATIGTGAPTVIAGPCAVESREQTLNVARAVRAAGGELLRGGVYKPRTNPHSFQGLGREGLEILGEVRRETGLGVVTEVLDPRLVEGVAEYADMLQIGSRSMQNTPLLKEVGKAGLPVLLKRGWSATLEEWLCAAEYIACEGNLDIVLCERGMRTSCHWSYAHSVLDLNVLEPARRATPLPVIVDPSHATGDWSMVEGMSLAALAAGTHGLLIEVIEEGADRSKLRCDAEQGIPPVILVRIMAAAREATQVETLAEDGRVGGGQ